jgi:hypothetical protein
MFVSSRTVLGAAGLEGTSAARISTLADGLLYPKAFLASTLKEYVVPGVSEIAM